MAGSAVLLCQCPLLLPQNRDGTAYEGFVTAQVPGRRPLFCDRHFSASKASAGGQPWVCVWGGDGGHTHVSRLAGAGSFPVERRASRHTK